MEKPPVTITAKLKAAIEITRYPNGLMAGLGVIVGAIAGGWIQTLINPAQFFYLLLLVILCYLGAFLTASAGNVFNDVKDVDIDKINAPERVIPSGRLSRRTCLIEAIILMVLGDFAVVFTFNPFAILIIGVGSVLIFLYSIKLKRWGFIGNVTIGVLTGFCMLLGGACLGAIGLIIAAWPAAISLIMNIGREISKGVDDYEGDKTEDVKTLAVIFGKRRASCICIAFLIVTIIISPLPFFFRFFNIVYLFITLFGVDILIVYSIVKTAANLDSSEAAHHVKKVLKFSMLIGLLSFLIGGLPIPGGFLP